MRDAHENDTVPLHPTVYDIYIYIYVRYNNHPQLRKMELSAEAVVSKT